MHLSTRTGHNIHRNMWSKVGAHPSTLTPSSRRSKSGSTSWTSAALVMFGSTSFYLFSVGLSFFFFHIRCCLGMLMASASKLQGCKWFFKFAFGLDALRFCCEVGSICPSVVAGQSTNCVDARSWSTSPIVGHELAVPFCIISLHRNFDGGGIFVPMYPCDICYKLFLCRFLLSACAADERCRCLELCAGSIRDRCYATMLWNQSCNVATVGTDVLQWWNEGSRGRPGAWCNAMWCM